MTRRKRTAPALPAADPVAEALLRFRPLLSAEQFAALQAELEQPLRQSLRANPLKVADPARAAAEWAGRYGWQLQAVPFCPTGWWVEQAQIAPSQTVEHRMGFYYIQDASSMLPVELFDFDGLNEPLILDLAASPGGKTTHLLSRAGDRGLTLANDSSQERLQALRIVLQNWGAVSSAVTHFPGEKFGAWYPNTFDRVLLDAPCSMQGLRATDAHPMRLISAREQQSLARRQARLLQAAFQAVKVGGQVVYSTCTLSPEEDECVLQALLDLYPGALQIDDLAHRLAQPAPGLSEYAGNAFHPNMQRAARIWPHSYRSAGFFAARLTKLAPTTEATEEPPFRPLEKAGLSPMTARESGSLSDQVQQHYGLDLPAWLEVNRLELWQRREKVYAFPQSFLIHFSTLPVQAAGMLLGEFSAEGCFMPSHEWSLRVSSLVTRGRMVLTPEQASAWLRGEDIQGPPGSGIPAGGTALVFDELERPLGRGKVHAGRLKNLLPGRVF